MDDCYKRFFYNELFLKSYDGQQLSKQWYLTSFAAAQIAKEVEKAEKIRAKEASSLNEPSTSTVCTCSSIWIGQTYLTVIIISYPVIGN